MKKCLLNIITLSFFLKTFRLYLIKKELNIITLSASICYLNVINVQAKAFIFDHLVFYTNRLSILRIKKLLIT